VATVVVEHRDRLGRMNTELVEAALSAHGVRLVVLYSGEVTDDLVQDYGRGAHLVLRRVVSAPVGPQPGDRGPRVRITQYSGRNLSVPRVRMCSMSQRGASTRTAKPLKRAAAAARLSIEIVDPPDLGRQWTKADVLRLRRERPGWLTAARQRHAAEQKRRAEQRCKELAAMLDAGGFTRPDDGSDNMIPYADEAFMYLLMVRKVCDADAQRAVEARWPSVADYEFDNEIF
jgi:hypothetical protein